MSMLPLQIREIDYEKGNGRGNENDKSRDDNVCKEIWNKKSLTENNGEINETIARTG